MCVCVCVWTPLTLYRCVYHLVHACTEHLDPYHMCDMHLTCMIPLLVSCKPWEKEGGREGEEEKERGVPQC